MDSVFSVPSLPTVLVLDDEATVRDVGRRFLEAFGYGCVEADSIERAVEILRTTPVTAAILDVRLPGRLTGLDLLTLFRQQAELSQIPVLIMTGGVLSDAEEASIARQRGFLFYKPEGFDTIVNFLDRITGRDRSH
ncbi:MAG TPA: response regulator [Vicinamibacterales bacterium]|jgi:CheY-like chemotaxis protein|nr:response regulator [Vicinamibacterales bacterium]